MNISGSCRRDWVMSACLVMASLLMAGGWSIAEGAAYQAGFATADITPPVGWRRAGSYTELVSARVQDPLYAKAMVIAQGDTIQSPVLPLTDAEYAAARKLMETLDNNGAPFLTVVVSLANDIDFYIPTRRAFEEGHYEPTTCPLEPGCGERLVAAALGLLNELKP